NRSSLSFDGRDGLPVLGFSPRSYIQSVGHRIPVFSAKIEGGMPISSRLLRMMVPSFSKSMFHFPKSDINKKTICKKRGENTGHSRVTGDGCVLSRKELTCHLIHKSPFWAFTCQMT